jgi:glutathione synthase/RimK-type ligase-like ATP-grasp enzyme
VRAEVALATCSAFPQLGEEEPLLLGELRRRGVRTEPVVWDDPDVDWGAYGLVVVRSTWDYAPRRDEFVAWAQSVPRILNPAEVIRWNTDKRYLTELPRAVGTDFIEPGGSWTPPAGEYVVKPAVSAGSIDTARYGPRDHDRARAHVRRLLGAGRSVMIQPYLHAVDEYGETALVFLGGEYSHAIRKGPMLHPERSPARGLYVEEDIRPREPSRDERAAAEEVMGALPWPRSELLYARVDLIDDGGEPRLVELELTEPSLFLSWRDGAASQLADLVLERL